jgi:hypothetical protein
VFVGDYDSYNVSWMMAKKISEDGNTILWSKTYDSGSTVSHGRAITKTSDGGFIIAGDNNSSGMRIIKIKSDGSKSK